jgi:folate-dependent phosphoribosylglycinamide formyltransferase PurN
MKALILTSGGPVAARIVNAWLSGGNSVSALWVGQKIQRRAFHDDRVLGLAAPTWSVTALARRHRIPIETHPKLSAWKEADTALEPLNADVLITAMTLEIVPRSVLSRFEGRAVNFHPALLPHYRGPSPRIGMMLDDTASLHGGVTLHCLSPEIDKGDIVGARTVPYDATQGFITWDVRLARAAGDLVEQELASYLLGKVTATPQPAAPGSYRRIDKAEVTLSAEHSAERTKWLCDRLGETGLLRLKSEDAAAKPHRVASFLRTLGRRSLKPQRSGMFTMDFDSADARVRVARHFRGMQALRYLRAIAQTRRSNP